MAYFHLFGGIKPINLKKSIFLLFFSLSYYFSCGQHKVTIQGVVKDTKGFPVQYAIVTTTKYSTGIYSDSLGKFSLTLLLDDTLLISNPGFEKALISVRDFGKINTVHLKEQVIAQNEIFIKSGNKIRKLGIRNRKANRESFVNMGSTPELCLIIDNPHNLHGLLSKVSYYITREDKYLAPFRVRIYSLDANGAPDKDLLTQSIIVKPTENNKWLDIEVADINILFSGKGIGIGMEWLNTSYDATLTAISKDQKIGAVAGNSFSHYMRSRQGDWFKLDIPVTPMMRCEILQD